MGLFGLLKYAYSNRLVKHDAITTPPGIMTPIAIDLWNVMYTLMEKFEYDRSFPMDGAAVTAKCFFSLLRLLLKRSYYPIFVSDRGIYGDGRVKQGAKAIVSQTMSSYGGSGRISSSCFTGDEHDVELLEEYGETNGSTTQPDICQPNETATVCVEPARKCEHSSTRWSALDGAPRLSYRLCVNLIRHLGYPYVNACNLEADDVCANLYHTNTVAQIYTTDTDLILMGCDIILDIMPLFPPTLRCCDVLMDLGVTYDEFLTEFVRCHTDLHETQTLASVQSVIRSLYSPPDEDESTETQHAISGHAWRCHKEKRGISWRRQNDDYSGSSNDDSDNSDSSDEDVACLSDRGCRYRERPAADTVNKRQGRRSIEASSRIVHLKYTSRYPPIMESAPRALVRMAPPKTRHEVLERKFVKHVVSMLTPERRGALSIIRRLPITQEPSNFSLVHDTLKNLVSEHEIVRELANMFWNHIPTPTDYNTVLVNYWDDCGHRRQWS
ncbi:tegument host shutoff protein [Equid alphaherpesvirus 4]|uniref:Virion host shutoff protein n=1 Tax=Equid alphaherpesvirus 4 TaxID=10331 RepID=A0A0X9ZH15_9ALPH|nr:tegument host shutoff protein [Equid alphaherpesvirus 4]AMB16136.1 tegument host shutoff protein [Equid alphaherpesvirus 4]AMB16215.1 tegument host shutoff protein [Equid alphaherpesvirus 4]BAV93384.1 tegument host shutoff protein [Equid alphaherpesvirus 4]